MVSQADSSYSQPLRGPSSVVSRTSSSRHRRHGRSHAGGSSYTPQNDFPVFTHTGDVEITINIGGHENRYLLHKLILVQCSGFFEAGTSQAWAKVDRDQSSAFTRTTQSCTSETNRPNDSRIRWLYELDTKGDDIPMLIRKDKARSSSFGAAQRPPVVRNKPAPSHGLFFHSVANLTLGPSQTKPICQADENLLRDYDNLFRIFYNHTPALDSVNIADAYIQCKSLLTLADMYDALGVVGPRIDHHLLQFQSRLWKQVAKYPASYLRLGYLARSKVIFSEALIHVVGQWPVSERHLHNIVPGTVLEIIEDKVDELAETIAHAEGRLFRLSLLTPRGERVNPWNGYLDWLVVSYFRQWLAETTAMPPYPTKPTHHSQGRPSRGATQKKDTYIAPPVQPALSNNARAFLLLGNTSPTAYLGHDECKRFLKLTPEHYSREALKRFERRLEELKLMGKDVVNPLMRCELQLGTQEGLGYFTCTRVNEADYCWK